MQVYSDPSRESDPHALPDVEVFYTEGFGMNDDPIGEEGWYWQFCFPGCLPDSDPVGPFATAELARSDAQSQD